jgi:hypothetical protein
MTEPTAEQITQVVQLVVQLLEARGDEPPGDPRVWRQLIAFAPRWVVFGAGFRMREERRLERRVMRRAQRRV